MSIALLLDAAENGDAKRVEYLIDEEGVNVNGQDEVSVLYINDHHIYQFSLNFYFISCTFYISTVYGMDTTDSCLQLWPFRYS